MAGSAFGLATLDSWIRGFAAQITENARYLTDLDAAIGDADHGVNMDRGMTAVVAKLDADPPHNLGALCKLTAGALISSVGGASGPLYGTFFLRMAQGFESTTAFDEFGVDAATLAAVLRAGVDGVIQRGHADPGDKTMVDALLPAVDTLDSCLAQGTSLPAALRRAAEAAAAGRDGTEPLVARKGRASYLGERSAGHVDPGAASAAMLMAAAATAAGG